jgi:hypothetical protein
LISVFTIGLVSAFGDNVRALFSSADNSLAGVDSTPASRLATADAYSLKGKSQALGQMAALDKAIREDSAFGDWQKPAASGFNWKGWGTMKTGLNGAAVAAVGEVDGLKQSLAGQVSEMNRLHREHREAVKISFGASEKFRQLEFSQSMHCDEGGQASAEDCAKLQKAIDAVMQESTEASDRTMALQGQQATAREARDATVAALREKLGPDTPMPEYRSDEEQVQDMWKITEEIWPVLNQLRALHEGGFYIGDYMAEDDPQFPEWPRWDEEAGEDAFRAKQAAYSKRKAQLRLRFMAEKEAEIGEHLERWLAVMDYHLRRLGQFDDEDLTFILERDLNKYSRELRQLQGDLPIAPCREDCTAGEFQDMWQLNTDILPALDRLESLYRGDFELSDFRIEELDSDLPGRPALYDLSRSDFDQAFMDMRVRFLSRELPRIQRQAKGWQAQIAGHLAALDGQDGPAAREIRRNLKYHRDKLTQVQAGQPIAACEDYCPADK